MRSSTTSRGQRIAAEDKIAVPKEKNHAERDECWHESGGTIINQINDISNTIATAAEE
jgi:hypothetical protein